MLGVAIMHVSSPFCFQNMFLQQTDYNTIYKKAFSLIPHINTLDDYYKKIK